MKEVESAIMECISGLRRGLRLRLDPWVVTDYITTLSGKFINRKKQDVGMFHGFIGFVTNLQQKLWKSGMKFRHYLA